MKWEKTHAFLYARTPRRSSPFTSTDNMSSTHQEQSPICNYIDYMLSELYKKLYRRYRMKVLRNKIWGFIPYIPKNVSGTTHYVTILLYWSVLGFSDACWSFPGDLGSPPHGAHCQNGAPFAFPAQWAKGPWFSVLTTGTESKQLCPPWHPLCKPRALSPLNMEGIVIMMRTWKAAIMISYARSSLSLVFLWVHAHFFCFIHSVYQLDELPFLVKYLSLES